jgi:two-component system, NtrC family, response regulator AtoC
LVWLDLAWGRRAWLGGEILAVAERTVRGPADSSGGSAKLHVVVSGSEMHESVVLPEQGLLSVGRGDNADIRILDPQSSREHARLHVGQGVWIEDLGSVNGTKLGTSVIIPNQPVPWPVGTTVFIGRTALLLQERWERVAAPQLRSHGHFFDHVVAECARAEGNAEASFAVLRVHIAADADTTHALQAIDSGLRLGDLFAMYGPHEYEVLLPDSVADTCRDIGMRLKIALQSIGARPRIGISLYPQDGISAGAILAHACAQVRGGGPSADDLVICEPVMQTLYQQAKRAAQSQATVLILGETGVGKDVLANYIQKGSARANKPYVTMNCAALPETLLESHLFGHEKGAFTGADKATKGLIEAADGGTLFLDEVGEMSLSMQAKLLRAVDKSEITRVGATASIKVNVRYIAATNRNLREEIEARRFREDLYHRLAVVELRVPPLSQRKSEIEPLARRFLLTLAAKEDREVPDISAEAMALLLAYDWPGNVRELHNAVERSIVLCAGDTITPEHLPLDKLAPAAGLPPKKPVDVFGVLSGIAEDAEAARQVILDALAKCAGNQTRAAKMLGTNRFALVRRLRELEIPRPRAGHPPPVIH